MKEYAMILDAKPSMRTVDDNGFLHVALTPISKATVNPYLGSEIEGSKEHGFAPDKILYGLRDPKELEVQKLLTDCRYCWNITPPMQKISQRNGWWEA